MTAPLDIRAGLDLALVLLLLWAAHEYGAPAVRRLWRRYQFTRKAAQDDRRQRDAIRARGATNG